MAYKVRLSKKFASELDSICQFIARDSEFFATLFAQRVWVVVKMLNQFPEAGRIVPEYNDKLIREKFIGHYRLVYQIGKTTLRVLTICHGNRLLK